MANNDFNFNQDPYQGNQNPFDNNNQWGEDQYNQGGYNQGGYDQGGYDYNQGEYDQGGYGYNQEGYNYDQGGYGQDQYGDQQYQQYDEYGNPIYNQPPKNEGNNKKRIIIAVAAVLLLAVAGFFIKDKIFSDNNSVKVTENEDKNLPVIYGFNSDQIPVDKNGSVIEPVFDDKGELLILPIKKEVLEGLGISEEDYKNGEFNPFFDEAGRSDKEPVLDLDGRPISGPDGNPLLKIKNRDIIRDPAGDPFLNSRGKVWYTDDPRAPSREMIENETGLKYNLLDEKPTSQTQTTQQVEEEPKSVVNLDEQFFAPVPDSSKIKETPWRDMGLIPESSSKNYFVVYNYDGVLAPYEEKDYDNREVYGRLLNYDFFKSNLTYSLVENKVIYSNTDDKNTKKVPVVDITVSYNREAATKVIKTILNELRQKNWYPDLIYKPVDRVATNITAFLSKCDYNQSRSRALYKQATWYGIEGTPGSYEYWLNSRIDEQLNTLNKIRTKNMNNDQLVKLHYDIYNRMVNDRLFYYKTEACKEMNKQQQNSCPNPADLSTLEIKSDFIESIYKYAYEKSYEDFIKAVYMIHSEIRNPANKYNLVEDEVKKIDNAKISEQNK